MAAIGVDFGTCYSSAGFVNGDRVMALAPREERNARRVPSVFFHDRKKTLIGSRAVFAGTVRPQFVVEAVKKKLEEPFFVLDDKEYEPEEIVQEILRYLIAGAEQSLREEFHSQELAEKQDKPLEIVITVPVKFSEPRKKMIRDAAQSVVLESGRKVKVIAVIAEPVAAAVEYLGFSSARDKSILVYDLGGGTFDTAIVQAVDNPEEPYIVIGQDGKGIGGNDWDMRLLQLMEDKLKAEMAELSDERREALLQANRHTLLMEATKIKEELSELEETAASIPLQGNYYDIQVKREEFEAVTEDLKQQTIRMASRLMKKYKEYQITDVILVGGSSYMPQIQKAVKQAFPECRVQIANPEFAISYGAARYAKMLEKLVSPVKLKATHTYGIGYLDEEGNSKIFNLIYSGDELPVSVQRTSKTSKEGRYSQFTVFESDCSKEERVADISRGEEIMSVKIRRDEVVPAGTESTQTLTLNRDNILEITAVDSLTGRTVSRKLEIESHIV